MIKILSWNCRGLGSPRAINALKRVLTLENPQIIFLSETKLKAWEMEGVKNKLRNFNMVAVCCEGEGRRRRGGVAMLWSAKVDMSIQSFSLLHIDSHVCINGAEPWRFTGVYGYPEDSLKHQTCDLIQQLRYESQLPWICGGDFNLMMVSGEKKGGNSFNMSDAQMFRDVVEKCELRDMGFVGHEYTWSNNQPCENNIQERLDRFLGCDNWKNLFPGSFVSYLSKRKSDHLPILLHVVSEGWAGRERRFKKLFRFEEMWLREESCNEVVRKCWQRGEAKGCRET